MKRTGSRAALALLAFAGCAGPQQRTIEPTAAESSAASAPTGSGEDTAFVLSRQPTPANKPKVTTSLNIGDKWWRFRAGVVGASEQEVRERDANISEVQAPDRFWDQQTATEAVTVWSALCNECHGGRRKMEDATTMPLPPVEWGRGEGLFFGTRRRYADVFYTIYRGGPERNGVPSEMPAWRGKLPKELIWSLMYFLEYQSGGIEGRFPPSLYPRQSGDGR